MVTDALASEFGRLHRAIVAGADADHPDLPAAIAALVSNIDVYRSDYRGLSLTMPKALAATVAREPELADPLQIVATTLAAGGEPVVRLQQLCGAATAKAIEDCAFYRDARLVSLNEVGGDPRCSASAPRNFTTARRCGQRCGHTR